MKSIVIYWSATGHTEQMAEAIANEVGAEAIFVADADIDQLADVDAVFLGCPAMGAEELEDAEFEPFYRDAMDALKGKKIGLFGSYEWADGEWMETWEADAKDNGLDVVGVLAVHENDFDDLDVTVLTSKF